MYITYQVPPRYRQMTFEEMLSGVVTIDQLRVGDIAATRTICTEGLYMPSNLAKIINVSEMIQKLHEFNAATERIRQTPREELYNSFKIPKKSGGLRQIDAPNVELSNHLRNLKTLLSSFMIADHHTCAYAYVQNRSTIDAVKKHQKWESNWFGKFDFHGFFPDTTLDFVLSQLATIYPFALIMQNENGYSEIKKALELCFLNGGLPQGTPISPFITNVMMIPFDHVVANKLLKFDGIHQNGNSERFVYTRYADDILISCRVDFPIKKIEEFIVETLKNFGAPFYLNQKKTRYGSRAGSNWNLGLMLNKDNEITVGYREKKHFKAMIHNYLMDKKNGRNWELSDVQHMQGKISYFRMVEKNYIDKIINELNQKLEMNLMECIRADLRS